VTAEDYIRRALENAAASRKAIKMQSKLLPSYCRVCRRMHSPVLVWRGQERPYHARAASKSQAHHAGTHGAVRGRS